MTLSQDQKTLVEHATGIVQQIDLINRAVTVVQETRPLRFEVPPPCSILLHGERVKLRLLQPDDRVRVTYRREDGLNSAQKIEVRNR